MCVICVSDPAGSEVQQRCGLVVVRSAAVRDADRSVSVPRPRWRGAVPVHTNRQPCLSSLAHQRRQRHSDQGQTWFILFQTGGLTICTTIIEQSRTVCNLWCVCSCLWGSLRSVWEWRGTSGSTTSSAAPTGTPCNNDRWRRRSGQL